MHEPIVRRKSARFALKQALQGEIGARLDCVSMDDVEATLKKIQSPDSETSILERLQRSDQNKADILRHVLEQMSDHTEEHAVRMVTVWRYARQHQIWNHCTNPEHRTEDAFLDSLDGSQTVRICLQFGTSTDAARRGKINIIRRNWGEEWYERACQRGLLLRQERGAVGLSKRLLGQISDFSNLVDLNRALQVLDKAIQKRTTVGCRALLGLKATTTDHLLAGDLQEARKYLDGETLQRQIVRAVSEDEILELKSSTGVSSLSSFEKASRGSETSVFVAPERRAKRKCGALNAQGKTQSQQAERTKRKRPHLSRCAQSENQNERSGGERHERESGALEGETNEEPRDIQEERVTQRVSAPGPQDPSIEWLVEEQATQTTATTRAAPAELGTVERLSADIRDASVSIAGRPPSCTCVARGLAVTEVDSDKEPNASAPEPAAGAFESPRALPPSGSNANSESIRALSAAALSSDRIRTPIMNGGTSRPHSDKHVQEKSLRGSAGLSSQNCEACGGRCAICDVPDHFDEQGCRELFAFAHRAIDLEANAPHGVLQKWIRHITYARWNFRLTEGEGDVHVLTSQSFLDQARKGKIMDKPIIIKEQFADPGEWSVSRYADILETVFSGLDMDVRWHQNSLPQRMRVSDVVELCRTRPGARQHNNPANMLNLPDITGAAGPAFLRMDRFRLLSLLVERCKAEILASARDLDTCAHLGKQTTLTPFDVASCRRFNLLAWPGSFSGAHVDSNGSTWVRNLCGHKLWMFVPRSDMESHDWAQFAKDGDSWDPSDRARSVILGPGDVFVMRPGLVHAVMTLGDSEPCLMTGGSFWDDRDISHNLKIQLWIGQNQSAMNEPFAHQLSKIVPALHRVVEASPGKYFPDDDSFDIFKSIVRDIYSLGCDCSKSGDCDDQCKCTLVGRRCTPFCAAHAFNSIHPLSCMEETPEQDGSETEVDDATLDQDYVESP